VSTLTPKKREILERENKILNVARPMIVHEGYNGLSMDRIAENLNISKGTIYNHFSCKEEIIIALAIQNVDKRLELFKTAAKFKGPHRHRMLAIGQAAEKFVQDFPEYFLFEQILRLSSVREKTSEKRQAVIRGCELQCMAVVAGVVDAAIASGDFTLPKKTTSESIVFGLWSLYTGGYELMLGSDSLEQLGISDVYGLVRLHAIRLLDGFDWHPLSNTFDVDKVIKRINKEFFSS
jgi:AcrR family transcriptional regulator